ncbi:helix-turn-helix domain-containing protein [Streptomyces sp. NPDC002838]|uniref:Crp/Fnr family transcriptional regulator n=1 Tax=Streptomyces sp. NPDC002838 TaxID=3154436 RepID=UPI0033333036
MAARHPRPVQCPQGCLRRRAQSSSRGTHHRLAAALTSGDETPAAAQVALAATYWRVPSGLRLGRRLADLEQRLSDSVFKSVAQRIATTLLTLTTAQPPAGPLRPGTRHPQIALTHEQLAALAGTSRETCTKVLRDFADRHLIRLARGRITVLDSERLGDESG